MKRQPKPPREIPFAEIEGAFELASYWFGSQWCPAVDKRQRGIEDVYIIRVLRSTRSGWGQDVTVKYDYFDCELDGTIVTTPWGYAKDFKPGRIVGLEEAAARFAEAGPR